MNVNEELDKIADDMEERLLKVAEPFGYKRLRCEKQIDMNNSPGTWTVDIDFVNNSINRELNLRFLRFLSQPSKNFIDIELKDLSNSNLTTLELDYFVEQHLLPFPRLDRAFSNEEYSQYLDYMFECLQKLFAGPFREYIKGRKFEVHGFRDSLEDRDERAVHVAHDLYSQEKFDQFDIDDSNLPDELKKFESELEKRFLAVVSPHGFQISDSKAVIRKYSNHSTWAVNINAESSEHQRRIHLHFLSSHLYEGRHFANVSIENLAEPFLSPLQIDYFITKHQLRFPTLNRNIPTAQLHEYIDFVFDQLTKLFSGPLNQHIMGQAFEDHDFSEMYGESALREMRLGVSDEEQCKKLFANGLNQVVPVPNELQQMATSLNTRLLTMLAPFKYGPMRCRFATTTTKNDAKWVVFISAVNSIRNRRVELYYTKHIGAPNRNRVTIKIAKNLDRGASKIDIDLFIKESHLAYQKISKVCLDEDFPAHLDLVFSQLQNIFSGPLHQVIMGLEF